MTLEEKLQGTCSQLPHEIADEIFFPDPESRADADDVARKMCSACPVLMRCLAEGRHEQHGTWGGQTGAERGQLRATTRRLDGYVASI